MRALRMIDTLNANSNVGEIIIGLHSSIEWNDEVVSMMMNRFSNMYCINVWDYND